MGYLLDGRQLSAADVVAVARHDATVTLSAAGRERNRRACRVAEDLVRRRVPVYGRTTGVGARKDAEVPGADAGRHALRLLRSHAGGAGRVLPADVARATLVVRLNQIGAGGAGVGEHLLDAVQHALNAGLAPAIHELGSIGTGDVTALAEAGLSLQGENGWLGDAAAPAPVEFGAGDALAWMSSAARTLGEAALTQVDVEVLLRSGEAVAALALLGAFGDHQSLDERVQAARPHPGQVAAAAHLRYLLDGAAQPAARLQDAFAFRCLPQVHGAARDAFDVAARVLAVELNAAAENPLLVDGPAALHNGNFLMTHLALGVDHLRAALLQVGMSAVRQLAGLLDPEVTGLRAFLSDDEPASSGLMVLEYTAQSALAELRNAAYPVNLAAAHASRGVEDLASFADLAVRQLSRSLEPLALILACTLVAAIRALRLRRGIPGRSPARDIYELACQELSPDTHDRSVTEDIAAAAALISRRPLG